MMIDAPSRELAERFAMAADERPDDVALQFEREPHLGVRRSWGDLAERSGQFVRQFALAGLGSGSRCAITLVDHPDTMAAMLALWQVDATAVLVDAAWGKRLHANVVTHSGADFSLSIDPVWDLVRLRRTGEFPHPLPEGTAMLGYTSGSTGDPKGVPFTHSKLALTMQISAAAAGALHPTPPSRIACSARLSGSGTLNMHYIWAAFADATVVVLPELDLRSAPDYWRRIDVHGIEQTYLVPSLVEIVNMMARPRQDRWAAPLCLTGSAPVSTRLQQRFREKSGLELLNCYGISEAMCAIFFGHRDGEGRATNSVGRPPLLQTRLLDTGGHVVPGQGEGELQLSGATVLDEYYGNAEATAAAFDGRWLRTGDVMRRDAAGNFHLAGRSKDVVMKGGFAVYLNEVEEAALGVDGVLEAAAVALKTTSGEDIGLVARVERQHDAPEPKQIIAAIRDDLGVARTPQRVVVVDQALPRTGQNKVDRRAVDVLWAEMTGATR